MKTAHRTDDECHLDGNGVAVNLPLNRSWGGDPLGWTHPKGVQYIDRVGAALTHPTNHEEPDIHGPEMKYGVRNPPEASDPRRRRPPRSDESGGTMKLRPTDNHSIRSILRRILLLGIGLMVVAGLWAPAAHAQPAELPVITGQPLRPTLPAPTGHHRIGVVQLHLIDHTRPDPWVPA